MKFLGQISCHALLLVAAMGSGSRGEMPTARIEIDSTSREAEIPAALYGIFMEEINHAFDGGIYAELIQNRSFEEGVLPPGVKLVQRRGGGEKMELTSLPVGVPKKNWDMPWPWRDNCHWNPRRVLVAWSLETDGNDRMEVTADHTMNEASTRSLALDIDQPDGAPDRAALVNSGYWGINLEKETPYDLKFHVRTSSFQGTIVATLESQEGHVLARHEFGNIERDTPWTEFAAIMQPESSDPRARFVLSFEGRGKLQVDWVSLFPPTFKGRTNGLRKDLARYIQDYRPDFIRYPGGCYVQGLSWGSAPDWRTMVCPPEERPGMWGYWKYRSSDGFGYHEFLQFCEDVDADAMYVAFAGMTVHPQNNLPLGEIGPVVQQTLDAIEYAIGPVDSKWGAVRAKMGHPEPFPLKYIEIGNEHPPAVYGDYYKRFRDAIKDQYPDMVVIMSMYWSGLNRGAITRAGDENIDLVDEHAYRPADWVRTNFDYFDKYDRSKPWKVYVGEYASHHGNGDLKCALSDSVYLMMLERNGDVVKMASYAPLFVNVNDRSWGVNLIEFDSSQSFAHASYYVQKLFNDQRPDHGVSTSVDISPAADLSRPSMAGNIGLATWNTQSEFKNLRVYDEHGELLHQDDFASLDDWSPVPGDGGAWSVDDGVLRQSNAVGTPTRVFLNDLNFERGRITVQARRVGGDEGFLLLFNADGTDRYLFCNFGANKNQFSAIQPRGAPEGYAFQGGQATRGPIELDRWYDLELRVDNQRAEMRLDGEVVADARLKIMPSFFATAGYRERDKSIVVKATNFNGAPVTATIEIAGASSSSASGEHFVISSRRLGDHNSLDRPQRIVPRRQLLETNQLPISVTLPPYSVNLLAIPIDK